MRLPVLNLEKIFIGVRLSAVRKMVHEARRNGMLGLEEAGLEQEIAVAVNDNLGL
jgi:hypothetical protein